MRDLKEALAEQMLENRLLKKHDRGWGRQRMRYPASEKLEIIRLVERSHLPVRRTLDKLGIPATTFYRWYDRYRAFGSAVSRMHAAVPVGVRKPRSRTIVRRQQARRSASLPHRPQPRTPVSGFLRDLISGRYTAFEISYCHLRRRSPPIAIQPSATRLVRLLHPRCLTASATASCGEGRQAQQDRLPGRPSNRGLEDQQPRSDRGHLQ